MNTRVLAIAAVCASLALVGCQTTQVGAPNAKFDGNYSFKYTCDDGAGNSMSSKWDGSSFVFKNGAISNNRAGAGRFTVSEGSRIDERGE